MRLACLANFSTEGRGEISPKEGISTTTNFTKQGNVRKLEANDLKGKATEINQTQLTRGKHYEKIFALGFEEATKCLHSDGMKT